MYDYFYRFMSFLEGLIPAILILLPVVLYYAEFNLQMQQNSD